MRGWRLLAALCLSLVMVAGCGDDNPTSPTPATPTPAPTPAPTPHAHSAGTRRARYAGHRAGQRRGTVPADRDGYVDRCGPRPAGPAVALQSGNTDAAKVPSGVTVAEGSDDRHVPGGHLHGAEHAQGDDSGDVSGRHPDLRADGPRPAAQRRPVHRDLEPRGATTPARLSTPAARWIAGWMPARLVASWRVIPGFWPWAHAKRPSRPVTTSLSHPPTVQPWPAAPRTNGAIGLSVRLIVEDRSGNTKHQQ